MSVDIKIKETQRKFLMENEMLFRDEDCNVIIPYLPSGYVDYSNNGYVTGQYKIDNFLTYKRVYTGNDCFIVTWKNSTYIKKDLDSNGNIQIGWQLGEYIFGYNEGFSSSVEIEQDESFSEYKKQSSINTITFRIRADQYDLDEQYKYMFYKVPEINKDVLYRVVNLEVEYVGRVKVCYVLTLQSLQQELENTGKAKQQNVMPNAPGQGYYDPKIIPHKDGMVESNNLKRIDETRWMTIDFDKFLNDPIRKVVVKTFGLGMIMNFTMVGRKITRNTPMHDYGIPRLIFPINFRQATTPTLYRTQSSEDNYYFAHNVNPTILFTQDILESMKNFLDINKYWSQQGILKFEAVGGHAVFKQTNPIVNGRYSYSLFGQIKEIGGKQIYTPWRFELDKAYRFDTRGVYGCATSYTITKRPRAIHDYLWDCYWVQKQISRLPIKSENTLSFGSLIGVGLGVSALVTQFGKAALIAGGILFGIGLVGSLVTRLPNKTLDQGVMGIVPSSLFDFMMDEVTSSLPNTAAERNHVKLSYFLNDEQNQFLTFFNTQTMNTSFEAYLTDLFLKNNRVLETTFIGQTNKDNGTLINDDGSTMLMDGSEELQPLQSDGEGFIIDSFNLQSMFSGDFSVEFLNSSDQVVWSGVYQSEAKWTGSVREINTWRNTSIYGRENTFLENPRPWPASLNLASWEEAPQDINVRINAEPDPINIVSSGESLKNILDRYYINKQTNNFNTVVDNWRPKLNDGRVGDYYIPGRNGKYMTFDRKMDTWSNKIKILNTNSLITKEEFFNIYGEAEIYINNQKYPLFQNKTTTTSVVVNDVTYSYLNQTRTTNPEVEFNERHYTDYVVGGQANYTTNVGAIYWNNQNRYVPQIGYELKKQYNITFSLVFENDGVYLNMQCGNASYQFSSDYIVGIVYQEWDAWHNNISKNKATFFAQANQSNNEVWNWDNLFFGEGIKIFYKNTQTNAINSNAYFVSEYHDNLAGWNDSFTINNIIIKQKQ